MSSRNDPITAGTARSQVQRVEQFVQSGRRWRARTFLIAGIVTVAYFAVLGGVRYRMSGLIGLGMTMVPIIAVAIAVQVWNKRNGLENRKLQHFEYLLANVFAVLVCVAGVLAVVLPHPVPAAFAGVIPGAACLVGAWRVTRR